MKPTISKHFLRVAVPMLMAGASGCSDEPFRINGDGIEGLAMELTAGIEQTSATRADESGFADGDRFGLFVVNYHDGAPGTLTLSSNQVNNVAVGYKADSNTWTAATDIYWLDSRTMADAIGYYPFNSALSDVESYRFEVEADQSRHPEGEMGSYEASDFLRAIAPGCVPGEKINLRFQHIMAGVKVTLQQGDGFDGDAWSKLMRIVTVDNTLRTSAVNLATGAVTPTGTSDKNIVMNPEGESYRAVVVPQTVDAGKTLLGITIDGKPYACSRRDPMKFTSGKLHNFTIRIDRKAEGGDYALKLVSEQITPWEADETSHDFLDNAYLSVNVEKEGTLKECLQAMNCDISTLQNLKVTGKLTDEDFRVIREEMGTLSSLNLRDAKMVHIGFRVAQEGLFPWDYPVDYMDDMLPDQALLGKETLRRIVLPEGIVRIGRGALGYLRLTSALIIPESVKIIEESAFIGIGEEAEIVMPSRLEHIAEYAFAGMGASMELRLTNSIIYIGEHAFDGSRNVYGAFCLPNKLEYLGEYAFWECGHDLTGDIVIPLSLKEVPGYAFGSMGFANGTVLTIPEGVSGIGGAAFSSLKFRNHVVIPSSARSIGQGAFKYTRFLRGATLPETLLYLGPSAFGFSSFSGTLVFPKGISVVNSAFEGCGINGLVIDDNVAQISDRAFEYCGEIRDIRIGKNVEFIGERAFAIGGCLERVVCMAKEPPSIRNVAFDGIYFDKVILEVPEGSVEAYRKARGWSDFRNITPHHELAFNLPDIACLDKGITRKGIVRAEGAWEVAECPSWVHVVPDQADWKEEVTVTVDPSTPGSGREGQIVFRLVGKDYTTSSAVRQLAYNQPQDEEIVLQTATGAGREIPVFIVGEGFGADNIASGEYMRRMNETMEQLFAIEPYKTHRDKFTVTTSVACSPDAGAGDVFTVKENCFDTDGVTPNPHKLKDYVKAVSSHAGQNLGNALIIMVSNHPAFSGWAEIHEGCSMAGIGITDDAYPYDQRGLVQHYAGGAAFAGLGSETVTHFEHIKGCTCPGCNELSKFNAMKSAGYFANLTLSSRMGDAPWADFIFHPKYSHMVDMWEGGYQHLRGVWRSEPQSVMGSYIAYYNTISRYAIYKEIMRRCGSNASLADFIANDKIEIP